MHRRAEAFAPAAITNFFQIHYSRSGAPDGATGGGYILSKGTRSIADFTPGKDLEISTVVNGDPDYNARTTRRALESLAFAHHVSGKLVVEQAVETPIGSGIGASAASSVSGVYAAARSMGIREPKRTLAMHAHNAEIIEQTGLGTVSVVYDARGAGAIVAPGEPGRAEFRTVRVPSDLRIVTAFLAPYDKKDAISSKQISGRINRLGGEALSAFLRDPTLSNLAEQGELFSRDLGLESPAVRKLIAAAKSDGAMAASQNMIGYAIHALVSADRVSKVSSSLASTAPQARIDVFGIGDLRAGARPASRR